MTQVQCPNCGGYKVITESQKSVNPSTGKKVTSLFLSLALSIALCGWIAIYGICFIGLGFLSLSLGQIQNVSFAVATVVVLIGGIAVFPFLKPKLDATRREESKAVKLNAFRCELCGYRWEWREDLPLPQANVNPELIAKGAKKLEDDARRRQEEIEMANRTNQH